MNRRQSEADRYAVERAKNSLLALQGAGHTVVEIPKVLAWLGSDATVTEALAEPVEVPDPRADPITGCLPVTPDPGVLR
jgi:hypothetical protein